MSELMQRTACRASLANAVEAAALDARAEREAYSGARESALFLDHQFTRHVRANVANEGGVWRADAVYTISPELPQGTRVTGAGAKVVMTCAETGIPTV